MINVFVPFYHFIRKLLRFMVYRICVQIKKCRKLGDVHYLLENNCNLAKRSE